MQKFWIITLLITTTAAFGTEKLNLHDCINIALEKNPGITIASKQVNAYKSGVRGSYGSILPYVSLGARSNRSTQGPSEYIAYGTSFITPDTTTLYYSAGVTYSQNIFDGGKWWNNIRLAKNSLNTVIYDQNLVRQSVIANVTGKFYNVLKAKGLLNVYKVSLKNSQEQLVKTEEMYKIGQVAKKDLFKAQVSEGNDRLNVIRQRSMILLAISDLNIAIGQSPNTSVEIYEEEYKTPDFVDKKTAIANAIIGNQEYNSLIAQKTSAFLQYKIAQGDRFPTLSSTFSYYRGGPELSRTYEDFNKWWNTDLTFNLSFPLFDGFRRKTNIQQKLLNFNIYEDRIEQKKIEIESHIENLILTLNTYREMIEINELNIKSAKEDLRLAQEMYRLNSATLLEVLDAQVTLTRAQGDLITTKYDAKIAEAQLALVMGTL
ncbi:MAG: TolC family protein [Candidatus Marinimicrobia bacterium]|nr:TolC family protein [Candidatus Neomarinimicrobiota bacterium]